MCVCRMNTWNSKAKATETDNTDWTPPHFPWVIITLPPPIQFPTFPYSQPASLFTTMLWVITTWSHSLVKTKQAGWHKTEGDRWEYTNTQRHETHKNCHPHQQYSTFLSRQHLSTMLCSWESSDLNLQHTNWLYWHSPCLSLISRDKCQDNRV